MQSESWEVIWNRLVKQLSVEEQRESCIADIGGITDAEIAKNAQALLNKAPDDMVIAALRKIEGMKGKCYAAVVVSGVKPPAFVGIPETLLSQGATVEEVAVWYDQIIKNSFANGTKFQPLPSHDEAWQTFYRVRTELTHKQRAAEKWLYTLSKVPLMNDADIVFAAQNGFWCDLTLTIKRRLFKLLPALTRLAISSANLSTTQAMQAVQDCYYKPGIDASICAERYSAIDSDGVDQRAARQPKR